MTDSRATFDQLKAEIQEKYERSMNALQILFPEFLEQLPPARPKPTARAMPVKAALAGAAETNGTEPADESKLCAICTSNRIRSDNSGCPKCHRKVCKDCKVPSGSTRAGLCRDCGPTMPDTRDQNGGARPNSGPRPKSKPFSLKKPKGPFRPIDGLRPERGQKCESCDANKAVVKCAGCSKMICGKCAQFQNGQCRECATVAI